MLTEKFKLKINLNNMFLFFIDPIVWYHVFRQCGSLLLDSCDTCIK